MVEFDGQVEVTGADGPVPFISLFQGREELVAYKHMWWDGAPHQGQCEGCTFTAWHLHDVSYLNSRGVSYAVLTTAPPQEIAPFVEFMGYTQPGTRCVTWSPRSVGAWARSSVSCATATARSSLIPPPAAAWRRPADPSPCST